MTAQIFTLEHFPSPREVVVLGPNSGTAHRMVVNGARQEIHARVKIGAMIQRTRPVPPPVVVTLRYIFPTHRKRDEDNFAAIGKPVIDGLVRAGVLAGDSAELLTERVEFVVERGEHRLDVIIASRCSFEQDEEE